METNFVGVGRLWEYAGAPDADVHNSFGSRAEVGDFFRNTVSNYLYFCIDATMSAQVWQNIVYSSQVTRSQSSVSRSLNSGFQVSSTRDSLVNYSVDISTSLSLTTGQAGTVFLEIASDSGFTTNVQEIGRFSNGNTGTLTIGLALTQNVTGTLSGYVPAGYYSRLRTSNTTGTPTYTYRSGQEVLL